MSKKRKIICIGVLILLPFVWSVSNPTASAGEWPKSLIYIGSRTGSGAYAAGVGISAMISKYTGVKTVPEPGGAAKNAILLHKKEVHLGNVQSDTCYEAVRGLESFKEFGKMNIRLMFTPSLSTPCAFTVRRDSGITLVTDLKGKKVMAINPASPAFTRSADMTLEAVGMGRKDITALQFTDFAEASQALQGGRISGFIHPYPAIGIAPALQEFNASVPARLIAAPWDKLEPLLPKYPYFSKAVLTAKDHGEITNDKDLITIGFKDLVVSRTDIPDDLVFEVMKAIFDHLNEIYAYHPVIKSWTDNPLSSPIVPFHPGAIKYYKEKGLWTNELENKQKKLLAEVGASR